MRTGLGRGIANRLIKANQDLLASIAKDYRIELAREFSAKPSAEVETVATMIKNRMDALRGYDSAETKGPRNRQRPLC